VTRRRWLLLLALLALGLLAWRAPDWGRRRLEARLGALFARPATIGSLRVRAFPLRVELGEVRVAGPRAGTPPFLALRQATLRPSLLPGRGGLRLRELRLAGLRVRVQAYEQGGDDVPSLKLPEGGGEARIARLVVEDAEVIVDHRRVPLALDLPDVHGALAAAGEALIGRLSFGSGSVRVAGHEPLRLASDVNLTLRGGRLDVQGGRLRTEKTDLQYGGTLQLRGGVRGELMLAGPVDLAVLDRHVMQTGFGLSGHARYLGLLRVAGSQLDLEGRLEGTQGEFDGHPVARYGGDLRWKQGRLELRGLSLSALGGSGLVNLDLPAAPGTVLLDADVDGMDAEALSLLVFDVDAAGLGASATGRFDLRWPRGRQRELSGTGALELAERADGRTPLSGRLDWESEEGRQRLRQADLRTAIARVVLSGRIERDRRADLALDVESADLAAADELLLRVRRALRAPDPRPAGMGGSGAFHGRWRGSLDAPVFEGRFTGQDFLYLGVNWGRAEWAGTLTAEELRSHSLVLRRDGGELWLDGRLRTGVLGEDDALEVAVRLVGWPASDLARALDRDLPLQGRLSGEAAVHGRRSRPQGQAALSSPRGRSMGVPYEDLRVALRLQGDRVLLRDGRARVGGGGVRFHGSRTEDGVYDAAAEMENVDVSALAPSEWPAALRPGGRLRGTLVLQGPLERPRLRAQLGSPRLFLGEEGVGALSALLSADGDGRVEVTAACRSARLDVEVTGSVGLSALHAADLRLAARETSLDPFLRARYPELPLDAPLVVSGEAEVRGPLREPRALALRARLTDVQLNLPDYPVRAQEPVALTYADGRLELGRLQLRGEDTDLTVSGAADLLGRGPLSLEARGSADLRVLSLLSPELRGGGAAALAMSVTGDRQAPHLDGTLDVQGGALRVRRFPHGIEQLQGRVRFTQQGAHIEGGTGVVGGAPVRLAGQAAWSREKGVSFDVQAAGQGISLRYPEGLRSVIDADLRLFGDLKLQWLTGQVQVQQAIWSRRYDVASELMAERHRLESAPGSEGGLHLDLKVSAPGTLKVDNNLATLQARADLQLQGTAGLPVVTGRAEVDRGRVYFQGNTYLIRRGSIDFASPRKTEPVFDIEAETRIHSYRVTLRVNGTLERVYPTLSSDPYLSQVAILSLLAGADESVVAGLESRRDEAQARLAATGAYTLAAGRIAEEMGLERNAERLFGLNRFSIDPSAVRGDVTNPTARLTVGKRVTPDVALVYSIDLRSSEDRLVSVEYTVSERVSLLFTRADPGGFGFDLRLRQSR
jgi:autotransporter translocation and assembly factor TamB